MEKKGRTKRGRTGGKMLLSDVGGTDASENGYKPEGAVGGGGGGKRAGKMRKNRKGGKGGDETFNEEEQRRLSEDTDGVPVDRAEEMERRSAELRARKQQEIRDRYKDRRGRDTEDRDLDRMRGRDRESRDRDGGDRGRDGLRAGFEEDYLSQRHQEIRDRHSRRDKERGRDRTGRRDRKRPDDEGRHAVLRRRIEKHANLFTPAELAEIDEDLRDHKVEEDKLDAARDKLNSQFDAVRDIDDRDKRLARLEQLKDMRNSRRDADRQARDVLREQFQAIRDRLEAKLKTEL